MKNCLYLFLLLITFCLNTQPPIYDPNDAMILELPDVSGVTIEQLINEIKEAMSCDEPPSGDDTQMTIIEICGDY